MKFVSILRLLELIKEDEWKRTGEKYANRLADALFENGFTDDARLVREKIRQKNGEDIPLAVQD